MLGRRLSRPKLIYSTISPHSGKINVWQQGKERVLEIGGYPQSVNPEAKNLENRFWGRMAEESAKRVINPEAILILGLGGGTVVHLLAQKFPGILVDGVDLDPVVVEVGERFFDLKVIPNLQVIIADAYELVKKPESYNLRATVYSIVIIDLFLGGGWSSELDAAGFHKEVKDLLAEGGVAVFNRVSGFDRKHFRVSLSKVFAKIEEVEVGYKSFPFGNIGNTLYFCS